MVAAAAVGWQLREGRVACVCHSHIYTRVQIDLQHPRPCPPHLPMGLGGRLGAVGGEAVKAALGGGGYSPRAGPQLKPHAANVRAPAGCSWLCCPVLRSALGCV